MIKRADEGPTPAQGQNAIGWNTEISLYDHNHAAAVDGVKEEDSNTLEAYGDRCRTQRF